jgi:hypothetical protein
MVKPFFENIADQIIETINNAEKSIRICMAWFTDQEIMNTLMRKLDEGKFVEIILFDTEGNKKYPSNKKGIELLRTFKVSLTEFTEKEGRLTLIRENADFYLHSKFCVVDERIVITGSYNWSYPARSHIENIVIISDNDVAQKYLEEFDKIKDRKLGLVLDRAFPSCSHQACYGVYVKMRLYNYNNTSDEFTEEHIDFEICTSDPTHINVVGPDTSWSPFLDEIYDYEIERHQAMQQSEEVNKESLHSSIKKHLANHVGSRNDLFSANISDDILILAKVTSVLDGWDREETVVKVLWNHEIVEELTEKVPDFSDQIIESVIN